MIAAIDNGMGLQGYSAAAKYIVTALVLLAAVTIDAVARKGRTTRVKTTAITSRLRDHRPVHLAERIGDQFEPFSVGTLEVHRGLVHDLVRHTCSGQLGLQLQPAFGLHRQRDVVQASEHLGVGTEIETGEVEEGERLPFPMSKKKWVEPW